MVIILVFGADEFGSEYLNLELWIFIIYIVIMFVTEEHGMKRFCRKGYSLDY